ncbi:MAG: alpha/beta fold hydrolase, partial [Pseudomonadota bacterium]
LACLAVVLACLPVRADVPSLFGVADAVWDAKVSPAGDYVAIGCSPSGRNSVCIYKLDSDDPPRIFYPGDEAQLSIFYWGSAHHVVGNVTGVDSVRTSSGRRDYEFRRALSFDVRSGEFAALMENEQNDWINTTEVVSRCPGDPNRMVMAISYRAADSRNTGSRFSKTDQGFRQLTFDVDILTGKSDERPDRSVSIWRQILDADCNPFVNVIYNDEQREYYIEMANDRRRIIELEDVFELPMTIVGLSSDRENLVARVDYNDLYGMYEIALADGAMTPMTYQGVELGLQAVERDWFTEEIVGFGGTNHLRESYYTDPQLDGIQAMIEDAFPDTSVRITSFDQDREMFTIAVESAGRPVNYFLFERSAVSLSPLGAQAPHLAETVLPDVFPITFNARDGLAIPGYVTLPPGKTMADGPFPTIVMPHGGPEARDTAAFDWWSQAYAYSGFAVIQPNFRGSAGYGSDFRDAGFGEFGDKMVDDVVDAVNWAVEEGIADPRGVCAVGASYGGYSALMTALRAPERVSCVVAAAPVTDIVSHMERYERDTEVYRYWSRYAGVDIFADDDERTAISPMRRARDFRADVLLLHGEDDRVVEYSQSRGLQREWGSRDGLDLVKLENTDHFFRTSEARAEILQRSLAFLNENHPAN